MSRSYKKTPWCGDHKGKQKKRIANKVVRMWLKEHPDVNLKPGQFKQIYCSWDICDYGWINTWEDYWASSLRLHAKWLQLGWPSEEPDERAEYQKWLRHYRNK